MVGHQLDPNLVLSVPNTHNDARSAKLDVVPAQGEPEEEERPSFVAVVCGFLFAMWPVILVCLVAGVATVIFKDELLDLCREIQAMEDGLGWVIFVTLFTFWVILFCPTTMLELTAGFIFGFWGGFAINVMGKTTGGFASFLIARHCAKELVIEHIISKTIILTTLSKLMAEPGKQCYTVWLVMLA